MSVIVSRLMSKPLYEGLLEGEQVDVQPTVYEGLLMGEQVDVQTTVYEGLLKGE